MEIGMGIFVLQLVTTYAFIAIPTATAFIAGYCLGQHEQRKQQGRLAPLRE
jgi:hypothetical protein